MGGALTRLTRPGRAHMRGPLNAMLGLGRVVGGFPDLMSKIFWALICITIAGYLMFVVFIAYFVYYFPNVIHCILFFAATSLAFNKQFKIEN